jgi:hypothetical protein
MSLQTFCVLEIYPDVTIRVLTSKLTIDDSTEMVMMDIKNLPHFALTGTEIEPHIHFDSRSIYLG